MMSNAISGDGLGFSVSRQEYQAHVSALLPLWGLLFLDLRAAAMAGPSFSDHRDLLKFRSECLSRSMLILVYTLWAIKQLNYLSPVQALGVFALSWFTFPIYYLLTSFFFALPLFFMIPLIYLGYQWIRGYHASHTGERAYQQHLHTLTSNPQDADAHYQLGLIHLKRRNLDAARRYFENALKIDPGRSGLSLLPRTCLRIERASGLGHWSNTRKRTGSIRSMALATFFAKSAKDICTRATRKRQWNFFSSFSPSAARIPRDDTGWLWLCKRPGILSRCECS